MKSTGIAIRVARRFLQGTRWDNMLNGDFFTLRWNDRKWLIEESDTRITGVRGFLPEDQQKMDEYEMPTLFKDLKGNSEKVLLNVNFYSIQQYLHLSGDKGPEARKKVVQAYEDMFSDVIKQWSEGPDQDPGRLKQLESLLPKIRKKLVWKKVK